MSRQRVKKTQRSCANIGDRAGAAAHTKPNSSHFFSHKLNDKFRMLLIWILHEHRFALAHAGFSNLQDQRVECAIGEDAPCHSPTSFALTSLVENVVYRVPGDFPIETLPTSTKEDVVYQISGAVLEKIWMAAIAQHAIGAKRQQISKIIEVRGCPYVVWLFNTDASGMGGSVVTDFTSFSGTGVDEPPRPRADVILRHTHALAYTTWPGSKTSAVSHKTCALCLGSGWPSLVDEMKEYDDDNRRVFDLENEVKRLRAGLESLQVLFWAFVFLSALSSLIRDRL